MNMARVPVESGRPVATFAWLRLGIVAVALVALAVLDVPHRGRLLLLVGLVAAPLAVGVVYLARRAPSVALHPGIALVDLAILALAEALAPSSYGAVHFLALFLVAAHAHFQGEYRGLALGVVAVVLLVPIAALAATPVHGAVLAFYEALFVAATLSAGLFMGRLRTAESTGRLRARELSRRVIEAESRLRRSLAETIHDGPVQELVSLDLMIDAARRAIARGDAARAEELLREARAVAGRNIGSLRDEIASLGPYAMDEMTLDVAIEQCAPVWAKRYGVTVTLDLERIDMSNELCGGLFGVAQEAVSNAGRHARADEVVVAVRVEPDGSVAMTVRDDGDGFAAGEPPFATDQPGHIGLATMRERTELAGGTLTIDSTSSGTTVSARVPNAGAKKLAGAVTTTLRPDSRERASAPSPPPARTR